MGFDITFHPVSVADLQRFVFDVADDVALAPKRAKELTGVPEKQTDVLEGVLGRLPEFVDDVRREGDFNRTMAFAAAAVAGYLHPYWYARGSALSFIAVEHPEIARFFTPLPNLAKGSVGTLEDESAGLLTDNYAASGVVLPERLGDLLSLLQKLAKPVKGKPRAPVFQIFDDEGFDSLLRALAYAAEHGLGLMEASDLVVPISNEGFTDPDNMRAHFLDNEEHAVAGPPPKAAKKKGTKAAATKKAATKKAEKPASKKPATKKAATKKAAKPASKKPAAKKAKKPAARKTAKKPAPKRK
jgi:hypothetical protein